MPEEQLAKSGTYSASFGWSLSSTVYQLEDGHEYTHAVSGGRSSIIIWRDFSTNHRVSHLP